MHSKCLLAAAVLLLAASSSRAGWSSDPATNLVVADAVGDQVQPKVGPTADGGCWIGWFDNIGAGFDVRVQRLDAGGNELLVHNGVLVADRGFSSTQDWGLDVDAAGNCLLTFRDDSVGGIQITAAKVAPDGTLLWGPTNVQLTSTSDFVAAPKIAGTSDGGAVVAWTQNASVWVQKLDAGGTALWGAGLSFTPGAGSYSASDLHDAGNDIILAFVHQTGSFGSPRHLYAQKFDASGTLLWGAGHVAVFDSGSLQFGNFPEFVPDGSGGAVFSWYDTSSSLQCYVQHVLAGGTEAFAHNGAAVSSNAVRVRVSPWATLDASTGEVVAFWKEQNSLQSQSGVYGQRFTTSGSPKWGSEGIVLVPVGSSDCNLIRNLTDAAGTFVFWSSAPSFGQDRLYGAHVGPGGAIDIATFDVASTPSGKSRLDVERSTSGFAILAWSDDRSDSGDILAQNVNSDGSLGSSGVAAPLPDVAGAGIVLGVPHPNPSRGPVRIEYRAGGPGALSVGIFDVRGRSVRTLVSGWAPAEGSVVWDGRDETGARAASGVYLVRLTSGGVTRTERIARVE